MADFMFAGTETKHVAGNANGAEVTATCIWTLLCDPVFLPSKTTKILFNSFMCCGV